MTWNWEPGDNWTVRNQVYLYCGLSETLPVMAVPIPVS